MKTYIYTLKEFRGKLKDILNKKNENIKFALDLKDTTVLDQLLNKLRDDLLVGVETGYVDSMFRDEYYNYFGTKLHSYGRNCIKLSFFEKSIKKRGKRVIDAYDDNGDYFIDYREHSLLEDSYLGFAIIRPTMACLGRNVISPEAFEFKDVKDKNDIETCQVTMRISALGLEVKAKGFPHCTQDREMMSCAETTLWAIADYYGHKYSTYKSVLPSDIIEALRPSYNHRMLPSMGLTFEQISHGLMSCGFSPLHYILSKTPISEDNIDNYIIDEEKMEVLTCYVESGFPLALCLQGKRNVELPNKDETDYITHAAVCIGRVKTKVKELKPQLYKFLVEEKGSKPQVREVEFNVWNRSIRRFVINDDNEPCYKIASLEQPYNEEEKVEWKDVKITDFIVPLPSRVYMDAYLAIRTSKAIFSNDICDHLANQERELGLPTIRTFLASGRSFRKHIAFSRKLNEYFKTILLELDLPHFIWVSELGTSKDFEEDAIKGLLILDATESPKLKNDNIITREEEVEFTPSLLYDSPDISIIFYIYKNKFIYYDAESHELIDCDLSKKQNNQTLTDKFEIPMYKENIHNNSYKSFF